MSHSSSSLAMGLSASRFIGSYECYHLYPTNTCFLVGILKHNHRDFPGGTVVKNPPAMQGTRVRSLVREDPTCHGATKPMCHNYWACALKPASHNYWSPHPRACAPQQEKPPQVRSPRTTLKSSPHSPQLEKACAQQQRPNAAKNK